MTRSSKKTANFKTCLPFAVSLTALLIFGYYVIENADRYQRLFTFSVWPLFGLITLTLGNIVALGTANFIFIRSLNIPVSLNEAVGLSVVTTLANHLPFSGGIVAKSIYLKKRHQLSHKVFLSGTLALYVLFVATDGLLGLVLLSYLTVMQDSTLSTSIFLGFSLMAGSALVFVLPMNLAFLPAKWQERLVDMSNGWQLLRQSRVTLLSLMGVHLTVTMINAARLWIAFHAFSQEVSVSHSLIFSAASILTQLVTITPGGLGVREGIVAAVASVHGIAPDVSIVAVGLDRLVSTGVILFIGSAYSYYVAKWFNTGEGHTGEEVEIAPCDSPSKFVQ